MNSENQDFDSNHPGGVHSCTLGWDFGARGPCVLPQTGESVFSDRPLSGVPPAIKQPNQGWGLNRWPPRLHTGVGVKKALLAEQGIPRNAVLGEVQQDKSDPGRRGADQHQGVSPGQVTAPWIQLWAQNAS